MSQLIPTDRPVLQRGNPKNDMSLWGGVVVGTSDFAPAPAKSERSHSWKWIAGGLALVVAGVVAFLLVSRTGGDKPATSTAEAVAPVTPEVKAVKDAGVEVVTPDAAAVAVIDAGLAATPTVVAVNAEVDAISGVAPIIKPAKKKVVRKTSKKASKKKRK